MESQPQNPEKIHPCFNIINEASHREMGSNLYQEFRMRQRNQASSLLEVNFQSFLFLHKKAAINL